MSAFGGVRDSDVAGNGCVVWLRKCGMFAAICVALGQKREPSRDEEKRRFKRESGCRARFCERGEKLRALDSVASDLVNGKFYRFLRKFADSSNGADQIEKAVRLAKHIGTFPTGECLSNISELA